MEYILEVNNITKHFTSPLSLAQLLKGDLKQRESTQALENLTFSLEKGKALCILGPNGAGKSTLLRIISALLIPDEGQVKVNGYDIGTDKRKINACAGLVLDEERSFYWRLSGRQNLEFFSALYGFDRNAACARINELLKLFQVNYADKRFDTYSTGMKKKFALIRGLLHNPQLLLLDEPTKSLDYSAAHSLRKFIKEILIEKLGKTIVYTTHHIEETKDFADIFLILDRGKICGMGNLEDLRKKTGDTEASLDKIFLKLTGGIHV